MDLEGVRQRLGTAARIASAASLAMGLALSICTTARAQGADPSSPKQAPSVLTADTLTYDTNNQLITATGDVEISTGQPSAARPTRSATTSAPARCSPTATWC